MTKYVYAVVSYEDYSPRGITSCFKFRNKADEAAKNLNYKERERIFLHNQKSKIRRRLYKQLPKFPNQKQVKIVDTNIPYTYSDGTTTFTYKQWKQNVQEPAKQKINEDIEREFEAFTKTQYRVPRRVADAIVHRVMQIPYSDKPLVKEKFCY